MKTFLLFICTAVLFSCNVEPQTFNYGKDYCQFCKMTLMEPKFAAQIVTKKGKVFKFDDISCMVKYMNVEGSDVETHAHVVANDYNTTKFLNVSEAAFVQADEYRSPMGGNTAAFSKSPASLKGPVLTWKEIIANF